MQLSRRIEEIIYKTRPIELAAFLKALFRIQRRQVRIGTKRWWIDPISHFGANMLKEGEYESSFTSILGRVLKEGDIFVDLGANEGYFSILASELVGESGRVLAIEPQTRLWSAILMNASLNHRCNITVAPYAVSGDAGFVKMILHPSINTGATTIVEDTRRRFFKRQCIGSLPLSKIVKSYGISRIDLIKIDIEGYELDALRSAGDLLHNGFIRRILLEVHPRQLELMGQSVAELQNLLERSGFQRSGESDLWERPY